MRSVVMLLAFVVPCLLFAEEIDDVHKYDNIIKLDAAPTVVMGLLGHGPGASIEYSRRIGRNLYWQAMKMGIAYVDSYIWALGGGVECFPKAKDRPEGFLMSLTGGGYAF